MASGSTAPRHDDLDNYDVNADLSDDPFASPPPESTKKRKVDSGLGIDEEVSVQKRVRVPNVKLDEERLLGPAGIPKLRKRARNLKIKGKGHEFSDASRLLSFYQLWLDDLFPKAKFLDALGMVEKAGHKKRLMVARNDFINEGKVTTSADTQDDEFGTPPPTTTLTERPKTPLRDAEIPDDDDIYDATPRAPRTVVPIADEPDEDDLDALMAEAEGQDTRRPAVQTADVDGEDDLDALIAEAEGADRTARGTQSTEAAADNFDDDEAALQEMMDS
ncbi:hypothetical protein G7046_g4110 [Stylonectria norvegica]|nr:hypothetical protein G7046_g4110 [Stylonectria norvegica]